MPELDFVLDLVVKLAEFTTTALRESQLVGMGIDSLCDLYLSTLYK